MLVLGFESSCDDSGVALYHSQQGLIGHALYSQTAVHAPYGGVVPELASRDHVRKLLPLCEQLLLETKTTLAQIDAIAYTAGPGLAGALLVGASLAKSLAFALQKPAIAVHHMEGHLLASMLSPTPPPFPFIALLVSGGHTQLLRVTGFGDYELLGDTVDDAVGEAFDKTAKLLGLAYPGGPALSQLAETGVAGRFKFPHPMTDRPGLDFSFSGLKTFALTTFQQHRDQANIAADIALAFQTAVVNTLTIKCHRALEQTGINCLVVAGGVAANFALRAKLQQLLTQRQGKVFFPESIFCTDNGAMIAYAGCQHLLLGQQDENQAIVIHPRWLL